MDQDKGQKNTESREGKGKKSDEQAKLPPVYTVPVEVSSNWMPVTVPV
jgi:hypothetical protein